LVAPSGTAVHAVIRKDHAMTKEQIKPEEWNAEEAKQCSTEIEFADLDAVMGSLRGAGDDDDLRDLEIQR
jgi:hypothetical protein